MTHTTTYNRRKAICFVSHSNNDLRVRKIENIFVKSIPASHFHRSTAIIRLQLLLCLFLTPGVAQMINRPVNVVFLWLRLFWRSIYVGERLELRGVVQWRLGSLTRFDPLFWNTILVFIIKICFQCISILAISKSFKWIRKLILFRLLNNVHVLLLYMYLLK